MPKNDKPCDAYIIDTYKSSEDNAYKPGAILFAGRKKREVIRWHEERFSSQTEADGFVRTRCAALGLREAENEDVILRNNPK